MRGETQRKLAFARSQIATRQMLRLPPLLSVSSLLSLAYLRTQTCWGPISLVEVGPDVFKAGRSGI